MNDDAGPGYFFLSLGLVIVLMFGVPAAIVGFVGPPAVYLFKLWAAYWGF